MSEDNTNSPAREARVSMKKVPTVIGISGPPRSGKDTFMTYLIESIYKLSENKLKVGVLRMSAPLKLLATQMLPEQKYGVESLKDEPFGMYTSREDGRIPVTYRRVQIELFRLGAELFGEDWLGCHYVRAVHNLKYFDFLLMPDCGRPEEVQPILDMEIPFAHVRMVRNGTTFEGDSRVDFSLNTTTTIYNNAGVVDLQYLAGEYAKHQLLTHKTGVVLPETLTKV